MMQVARDEQELNIPYISDLLRQDILAMENYLLNEANNSDSMWPEATFNASSKSSDSSTEVSPQETSIETLPESVEPSEEETSDVDLQAGSPSQIEQLLSATTNAMSDGFDDEERAAEAQRELRTWKSWDKFARGE